jgi:hypothetical protein
MLLFQQGDEGDDVDAAVEHAGAHSRDVRARQLGDKGTFALEETTTVLHQSTTPLHCSEALFASFNVTPK